LPGIEEVRIMWTIRAVVLASVVTGAWLGLAPVARSADDVASAAVTLKKGDRIIFLGDSLTELAQKAGPKGYVSIVREALKDRNLDVEVDAVATGGHTVPDLLARLDGDVLAKKPTVVVIQIGCNDARRIDKAKFKSGLEELIDRLQQARIQVVLCSLTSVGEKHDGTNKDDAKLEEFAAVAREVATDKNVPLN